MNIDPRINEINGFWFGRVEETVVPSERRARIWFGEDEEIDREIREKFQNDLQNAQAGKLDHWLSSARGELALIIMLDQFSRHIYREKPMAYAQDAKALTICIEGINAESEHSLSLIERVFYYFPLLHSENIRNQEQSMLAYNMLAELAFAETRVIYDSFVKFANHHYMLIKRFGRFPQRNAILQRVSSAAEEAYLNQNKA